jgi:hypothetical protein
MEKFNRIYSLKVEVAQGRLYGPYRDATYKPFDRNVEVALPHTIEFNIVRKLMGSSQTATFKVYNLPEAVRASMQKDLSNRQELRAIQFRCGYAPTEEFVLPLVFNGAVLECYSYRDKLDWVTEISAFDGGFFQANANSASMTLAPGASAASVITMLARQIHGLSGTPIVGDFPTINKRGEVLFGNIWSLILQKSNGLATIDNGQVKALNLYEAFRGEIPLLSEESGLLGSPRRSLTSLTFDMLFEPRLSVGQVVELFSTSNRALNHDWKVMGFEHHGTVSPVVCGDLLTSVNLWLTDQALRIVDGQPVV